MVDHERKSERNKKLLLSLLPEVEVRGYGNHSQRELLPNLHNPSISSRSYQDPF